MLIKSSNKIGMKMDIIDFLPRKQKNGINRWGKKNGTKSWFLKPHHTVSKEGLRSNLETHPR